MNIKSAPVFFGSFPTMTAGFIALADLFGSLFPEDKPLEFMRKVAGFFTKIVVDVLGSIPNYFALARTKTRARSFGWFSANFTWLTRPAASCALRFGGAFSRTIGILIDAPFIGSAIRLTAMRTNEGWLSLCHAIAFVGTMLSPFPFWQSTSRRFGKSLAAYQTLFSQCHSLIIPSIGLTIQVQT